MGLRPRTAGSGVVMSSVATVFGRSGHVNELTMERWVAGELEPDVERELDAHIGSCISCRLLRDEIVAETEAFSIGPSPEVRQRFAEESRNLTEGAPAGVTSLASRRAPRLAMWGGALAAAAAIALVVVPAVTPEDPGAPPEGSIKTEVTSTRPSNLPPGIRLKGAPFNLEVYANAGDEAYLVGTGDVVHSGDRVGFRVQSRRPGHLLIVGADDHGNTYLCSPQDTRGHSVAMFPSDEPITLKDAVRFDDVLGQERIVALFCEEPFDFDSIAGELSELTLEYSGAPLPPVRSGCIQREVSLRKREAAERE